jgi:hypothetical protein
MRAVIAPKVAASHLWSGTEPTPLNFVLMFSSVASIAGFSGHANYAAANSAMDAVAVGQRASGLGAVAVQWGAWTSVGGYSGMRTYLFGRGCLGYLPSQHILLTFFSSYGWFPANITVAAPLPITPLPFCCLFLQAWCTTSTPSPNFRRRPWACWPRKLAWQSWQPVCGGHQQADMGCWGPPHSPTGATCSAVCTPCLPCMQRWAYQRQKQHRSA